MTVFCCADAMIVGVRMACAIGVDVRHCDSLIESLELGVVPG